MATEEGGGAGQVVHPPGQEIGAARLEMEQVGERMPQALRHQRIGRIVLAGLAHDPARDPRREAGEGLDQGRVEGLHRHRPVILRDDGGHALDQAKVAGKARLDLDHEGHPAGDGREGVGQGGIVSEEPATARDRRASVRVSATRATAPVRRPNASSWNTIASPSALICTSHSIA